MKKKISIYHIVCAVILLIMVIICIYPIVWMFFGSMKDKAEFYTNIWGLPKQIHLDNYIAAWKNADLGRRFINSLIVTLGSMCIMIPVTSCGCKIEFQRQKSDLYVFAVGDHDSGRCSGNSDIYGSNEDGTSEFPFGADADLCSTEYCYGDVYHERFFHLSAQGTGRGSNDRWMFPFRMFCPYYCSAGACRCGNSGDI